MPAQFLPSLSVSHQSFRFDDRKARMKEGKEQKTILSLKSVHRRKAITAYLSKRQRSVKGFLPKKKQTFSSIAILA